MFPNIGALPRLGRSADCGGDRCRIRLYKRVLHRQPNLHPFIVTLATQLIVYGALLMYLMIGGNNGQSLSGLDTSYTNFIAGSFLSIGSTPIPNYVWYAIILTVIMWFIWNKTTFGKNMFAVGSNPEAANVSGVNVTRTIILVFVLAGIMYGLTGFIESARIASNSAATGLNYELDAIAACVIGGVSFVGGIGSIRGVIIGVVLLRIIFVALTFLGIDANMQYIIKGLIILIACAVDMKKYLVRKIKQPAYIGTDICRLFCIRCGRRVGATSFSSA